MFRYLLLQVLKGKREVSPKVITIIISLLAIFVVLVTLVSTIFEALK